MNDLTLHAVRHCLQSNVGSQMLLSTSVNKFEFQARRVCFDSDMILKALYLKKQTAAALWFKENNLLLMVGTVFGSLIPPTSF